MNQPAKKLHLMCSCEVCGSKNIAKDFTYNDRHYMSVEQMFDVWQCRDCQLFFINPMPTQEELASYYPKSYYAYEDKPSESALKNKLVKFLKVEPSDLDNIISVNEKNILDFGCGSGWSLDSYKDKGYSTYGLDMEEAAIAIAEENGHIMSGVDLLSTNYESDFFDFIRSNHSMEHVSNPKEIINEFHRILKKNGKLFISLPNAGSLTRSIFKKYWYYTGVPYHTFNYNRKSLCMLLEKNGFSIDRVGYRSSWQGIFGSLAIYFNRNTNKASSDSFFDNKLFRILGIILSKLTDIINKGESLEVYASKK
jgi:2-polyprenyl-3-methyl-5-hydroxy-6-metoxy-1,4-benzoquinol methylase